MIYKILFPIIISINIIICCPADSVRNNNFHFEDDNYIITYGRSLYFADRIITTGMKGSVLTNVTISKEGIFQKFVIIRINVSDSLGNNIIKYQNAKISELIFSEDIIDESYYPSYISEIYKEIDNTISRIKIKKKGSSKINEKTNYAITFYINQ